MGVLGGAMTVARFRVVGDIAQDFRDVYRDRLNEFAFKDPPQGMGAEEVEGWVQVHNLLDTNFDDFNRWLYNDVALFAIRVDKKRLPAKLFKATLEKKIAKWCEERDLERCPAQVRSDMKDALEKEWLSTTLPAVAVTEAAWKLQDGYVILHSLSEGTSDRFRKRFYQTFGLQLVPWSPLDWLEDEGEREKLMGTAPVALSLDPSTVRIVGEV